MVTTITNVIDDLDQENMEAMRSLGLDIDVLEQFVREAGPLEEIFTDFQPLASFVFSEVEIKSNETWSTLAHEPGIARRHAKYVLLSTQLFFTRSYSLETHMGIMLRTFVGDDGSWLLVSDGTQFSCPEPSLHRFNSIRELCLFVEQNFIGRRTYGSIDMNTENKPRPYAIEMLFAFRKLLQKQLAAGYHHHEALWVRLNFDILGKIITT